MGSLLDYDTALQFLERVGVRDAEELLKKDQLSFLGNLIAGFLEHVPFQCASILAQTTEEKHVPTLEEVVEASLSMEGGVCFTLNTFMCILLRTLGFKADVLDACYSTFGDTHNHVIVLISDLRYAGDNYLIDVGSGFPFGNPLPLSELPCTRYHAGLEYRHEWHDGMILRLHREGDDYAEGHNNVMKEGWRQVFHIDPKPVTFDHFRPYMEGIYVDELACDFHSTLRSIRFPPSGYKKTGNDDDFSSELAGKNKDRIMVAFKNQSLLLGPMDNAQKTKLSEEEWADKFKEHFPTVPSHKVDLAIQKLLRMMREEQDE